MIFRTATSNDIPQLCELIETLFSLEADFDFDAEKVARGLELFLSDTTNRNIFVAENEGSILGMCSAQLLVSTAQGTPSGWIEDVVLREEARGQGLGPQLLEQLEKWCLERGATRLQVLCCTENQPAMAFYPKLGFESTQLVCLHKYVS
jgi:GNAT superfamily N-acetyltransferase